MEMEEHRFRIGDDIQVGIARGSGQLQRLLGQQIQTIVKCQVIVIRFEMERCQVDFHTVARQAGAVPVAVGVIRIFVGVIGRFHFQRAPQISAAYCKQKYLNLATFNFKFRFC